MRLGLLIATGLIGLLAACDECSGSSAGWEPTVSLRVSWGLAEDPATLAGHNLFAVFIEPDDDLAHAVCTESVLSLVQMGTIDGPPPYSRTISFLAPFDFPRMRVAAFTSSEERGVQNEKRHLWNAGETVFGVTEEVTELLELECTQRPMYVPTSTGPYGGGTFSARLRLDRRATEPCPGS